MVYFDKAGQENTHRTLEVARNELLNRGLTHMVVASTWGDTGLEAAKMLENTPAHLVVVTHNYGFKEQGEVEMDPSVRSEIVRLGGYVLTGTMVTRGISAAIRGKMGFSLEQVVADTLRIFGQGMKVCVEMCAMAADAGVIPTDDVVAVGGTGRGADTAVIIKPASSNSFFDIRVRDILAKPREF